MPILDDLNKMIMADDKNYFLYKQQYPDTLAILTGRRLNLTEFHKNAIFVLDTNSLLVPYNVGKNSLIEIRRIYKNVLTPKRVYVTAHTLREFAKHRSSKISDLFTEVDKALSTIPVIKDFNYPILEDTEAYKKLVEYKQAFSDFIKPYKGILTDLQANINEWNWFDPVTQLYHDIFSTSNIIDTVEDDATLTKEFEGRMKNGIPPGNQDANKEVNAMGDFLIWKSILEFGKARGVDIVFVTNDEKNDWMLKGNKKSISTRFELVDEYCRYSGGKQFICLNFADFLKMQGATTEVVHEVTIIIDSNSHASEYYSRVMNCLGAIRKIINEFLFDNTYDEEGFIKDENLEARITDLVALLESNYTDAFRTEQSNLFSNLQHKLQSILKLNYFIHFEFFRMKKSTSSERLELRRTCNEVIRIIEEIGTFIEVLY